MFTRHYKHYLLGREFTLRTDHGSLIWLFRFKHPVGQLGRWLEELSQYSMKIQHRPGVKHTNADALSRIPEEHDTCNCYEAGREVSSLPCGGCPYCTKLHNQWGAFDTEVDYVVPLATRQLEVSNDANDANYMHQYSSQELRESQMQDTELRPVVTWLESEPPTQNDLQLQGVGTRKLWNNKELLHMKDGVLYYSWEEEIGPSKLKFVVPQSKRKEVLQMTHDSRTGEHWGRDKTFTKIGKSFFWPSMRRDCQLFVDTCAVCHLNKVGRPQRAQLLHYEAGVPGERVHLDILGPFTTSESGNKYVLMILDQFTRWLELHALPEQTAEITAKTFFEQWTTRYGAPLQVHTDQGRNFDSQLFTELCELMQIEKTRTTAYRPCSNGQVERQNQMVLSFIRCYLADKISRWDEHLATLGMSLRTMVNRSTGFTPNMLMLGREVCMPEEILFGLHDVNSMRQLPANYLKGLIDQINTASIAARNNLLMAQNRQKKDYDTRAPVRERTFDVGDLVYIRNSGRVLGQSKKLLPIWKGPFVITKVVSRFLYRIAGRKREYVKHHDKLRICKDRNIPLWVIRKQQSIIDLVGPRTTATTSDDPIDGVWSLFEASEPLPRQEDGLTNTHPLSPRTTRGGRPINRPHRYDD